VSTVPSFEYMDDASDCAEASWMREWELDAGVRRHFRVEPSKSGAKKIFLNCHYCGYAPPEERPIRGGCPKCGSSSWDRFALAVRLVPRNML